MAQYAMQFKSLFVVLASAALSLAASTVEDVVNNVAKIGTTVVDLQNGLNAFPHNGGSEKQAIVSLLLLHTSQIE